jgi:lysophospholipase L1-like esterase
MLTIVKKNDSYDAITYQLENEDNSTVDLTGASVNFVMGKKNKLITNAKATVTSATSGIVSYQLTPLDTLVSGTFLAEFVVTFANGTTKTYPSNGYITVDVEQNLDTSQNNVVLDMIAAKQGDFEAKLNSILLQKGDINLSTMSEYTWTATDGQLLFTFPTTSNYSTSSKWFQVYVGGIPVDSSLVNRFYTNQFALTTDSANIKAGMKVHATWVEPLAPVVPSSYKIIPQQDLPPVDAGEGDLWFDTSDNTYQGTIFDNLNSQLAEKADIEYVDEQLSGLASQTVDLISTIPTISGYIGTDGTIADTVDSNWVMTDYVSLDVYSGSSFTVNLMGHTAIGSVTFYDASKVFIETHSATSNNGLLSGNITIPQNASFFKLSYGSLVNTTNNGYVNSATATKNGVLNVVQTLSETSKWRNKNVILIGDSISSTDYPWYKDLLTEKTGANVNNAGQSGARTQVIASNSYWTRVTAFSPDLAICLVGGNDEGDATSVGTFDVNSPNGVLGEPLVTEIDVNTDMDSVSLPKFIQSVAHIIRKYKHDYYNFRANAGLTGTETELEKTTKLDAVKKPKIIFCTTLPQKRNDASNGFSIEQNWIRKANAVRECCEKYDIPCLDLYTLCRWDMSLEPYYVGPTNTTNNTGIYTMDGLHPNKYGYDDITTIVSEFIKSI